MYSGDSATPTIVSRRRRPLTIAGTRSPGFSPCAVAKPSLTSTSSGRPGSIQRPRRRKRSFTRGRRSAGIEISRPVAGSSSCWQVEGHVGDHPRFDRRDARQRGDLGRDPLAAPVSARRRRRRTAGGRSRRAASPGARRSSTGTSRTWTRRPRPPSQSRATCPFMRDEVAQELPVECRDVSSTSP